MKIFALSTSDNPYNPFDDYENWSAFDHQKGYNSSEYLARVSRTSDKLTDEQNYKEIEDAIDEIISLMFLDSNIEKCNPRFCSRKHN